MEGRNGKCTANILIFRFKIQNCGNLTNDLNFPKECLIQVDYEYIDKKINNKCKP